MFEKSTVPRRPVIGSALSAEAHAKNWLKELDDAKHVVDSDGLKWDLEVMVQEKPFDKDPRTMEIILKLGLRVDVTVAELLVTGTLDPALDARTIALLQEAQIPMRMRPIEKKLYDNASIGRNLSEITDALRKNLKDSDLRSIKRALLFRWLDEQSRFGMSR